MWVRRFTSGGGRPAATPEAPRAGGGTASAKRPWRSSGVNALKSGRCAPATRGSSRRASSGELLAHTCRDTRWRSRADATRPVLSHRSWPWIDGDPRPQRSAGATRSSAVHRSISDGIACSRVTSARHFGSRVRARPGKPRSGARRARPGGVESGSDRRAAAEQLLGRHVAELPNPPIGGGAASRSSHFAWSITLVSPWNETSTFGGEMSRARGSARSRRLVRRCA